MKDNRTVSGRVVAVCSTLILYACIGTACDSGVVPGSAGLTGADNTGSVTVRMKAIFEGGGAFKLRTAFAKELCPPFPTGADSSIYQGEQDCDGDGGIIRYITPSEYKVAFKRLAFENEAGDLFDVIADTGTLANAVVLDLTTEVVLPVLSLPEGEYPDYYVEIYYHELTMPLYDPSNPQTIRVYVSDDDFPAEGNLGHHQGDITLIDAGGNELGFVPAGDLWQAGFLISPRGSINGAGGTDSQTGHLRGLFGGSDFWNHADAMQGPDQDIFILVEDLDLTVGAQAGTVTFSFDVQDAWFFEDFDNDQWFNPCESGNQDGCGGEWSPVLNEPDVLVE